MKIRRLSMRPVLFISIVSIALSACGPPPSNVDTVSAFSFLTQYLDDSAEAQSSIDDRLALQEQYEDVDVIVAAYNGQEIAIDVDPDRLEGERPVLSAMDVDRFRVDRTIFLTEVFPDRQLFSFDGRNWFENDTDLDSGVEALRPEFDIDWSIDGDRLSILFDWRMLPGSNPRPRQGPWRREVVSLSPGMILSAERRRDITHRLDRYVLRVPQGTELLFDFQVESNLFEVDSDAGLIRMLTDLYFYQGSGLPAVSFDNEDWSHNILSFEIENESTVSVDDGGDVVFTTNLLLRKR